MIRVPEILEIPEKLAPIITEFNNFRYFLLHGGRGSSKTQSIARKILYIGEKRKVRVVCGRETQNTIDESVYTVFRDLIAQYKLNYSVYKSVIVHNTTGSEIKFKGLREQGASNIKGLEKVDIFWIDEAQAITKNTLDTLIATLVRHQRSKVYFSMNRHIIKDPVYAQFKDHPKCLTIKINYTDNPYCSQAMLDEAERCRKESPEDYRHIWQGEPMASADNFLFDAANLDACIDREFPFDPENYGRKILGCDVARFGSNFNAGLILRQVGPDHWEEHDLTRWQGQDGVYTTGRFLEIIKEHRPEVTKVDADGLGGIVYDFMTENRGDIRPFHGGSTKSLDKKYKNWRTYGYLKLNDMINGGRLRLRSQFIIDQLNEIQFRFTAGHEKYIIPKEQLIESARKRGVKFNSPDEADALMMAVSTCEEVKSYQADTLSRRLGDGHQRHQYQVQEPLF